MSKSRQLIFIAILMTALSLTLFGCGQQQKFIGTTWKGVDSKLFGTVFNQLTPENAGKWSEAEPSEDRFSWPILDQMMKIAEERKMVVKEHTLVWYQQIPRWLTKDKAEKSVNEWFQALSERYGDKFQLIDAVNEPLDGRPEYFDGIDCGGGQWDWVIWSFKLARKYFPKSKLLINEYGILNSKEKTARYVDLIELLKEQKLVDGIGLQAHGLEHTPPEEIKANLETIKTLKLPIYISEWDISLPDDNEQLTRMKEQFPIFWDEPLVKGITFWGHLVAKTWRPDAFLVYNDTKYRPAFQWMLDYIAKK